MHAIQRALRVRKGIFCGALLAAFLGAAVPSAQGAFYTLIDHNSTVDIDTASQSGVSGWMVDGVRQLDQQWFWFRVGNTAEASIDTLPIGLQGVTDQNFDGNNDSLFVRYLGAGFQLEVRLNLNGGSINSGASDMAEQITIRNVSNTPLDFHFFQYNDFDLQGVSGGDTVKFTNANTVQQNKGAVRFTETVVTPVSSHREIDIYPNTLNRLNDGLPTNLSDTPIGVVVGPGDVTWAYQWDFLIAPGGTAQISKDKNLAANSTIPEPSSWALMALGALLLFTGRHTWR